MKKGNSKLGTASTDLFKGAAALVILLSLILIAERFSMKARIIFGGTFLCLYFVWYFEWCSFYERNISIKRYSNILNPTQIVDATSISLIRFYSHVNLATGTMVYIYYKSKKKNIDLCAFNFKRKHMFVLLFAKMNNIKVDFSDIQWIKRAYDNIDISAGASIQHGPE